MTLVKRRRILKSGSGENNNFLYLLIYYEIKERGIIKGGKQKNLSGKPERLN
jgi:hypothetical protein